MYGNYFIIYDLMTPGQDYTRVHDAIKSVGSYYQFQYSAWFVKSALSKSDVYDIVRAAMDANDRLVVVDAYGAFVDWPDADVAAINNVWFMPAKKRAA